jgi:hypothetical protein
MAYREKYIYKLHEIAKQQNKKISTNKTKVLAFER